MPVTAMNWRQPCEKAMRRSALIRHMCGNLGDSIRLRRLMILSLRVGVIPSSYEFRLNPAETDAVFSVPIASLLEPKCVAVADHLSSHGEPVYHFYCNGGDIWGATARIIVQFLDLVYGYEVKRVQN